MTKGNGPHAAGALCHWKNRNSRLRGLSRAKEQGLVKGKNWQLFRSWVLHGGKSHWLYDSRAEKLEFMAPKGCQNIAYCLHRGIFLNKRTQSFFPINIQSRSQFSNSRYLGCLPGQLSVRRQSYYIRQHLSTRLSFLSPGMDICRPPGITISPFPCFLVFSLIVITWHQSTFHSIFLSVWKENAFFLFFGVSQGLGESSAITIIWGFHILRNKHYGRITKILIVTIFTFNKWINTKTCYNKIILWSKYL